MRLIFEVAFCDLRKTESNAQDSGNRSSGQIESLILMIRDQKVTEHGAVMLASVLGSSSGMNSNGEPQSS